VIDLSAKTKFFHSIRLDSAEDCLRGIAKLAAPMGAEVLSLTGIFADSGTLGDSACLSGFRPP